MVLEGNVGINFHTTETLCPIFKYYVFISMMYILSGNMLGFMLV